MSKPLRDFLNLSKAIQSDMDALGVGKPAQPLPVPVDDIERVLRASESILGIHREGRLLMRRVQKWLDSLPKETTL